MVIRYRAWDKEAEEMVYQENDGYRYAWMIGPGAIWVEYISCIPYDTPRQILMQSTELDTQNGAEIFEGDIVVHEEGEYSYTGIVRKDKYYFYIEGVNINDSFSFDDVSNTLTGVADLEVIGNIYSNPELLEQANES
ncbi:hypothetical protein BH748_06770 [Enterococcus casseliflavus]|uniref:YopX family protein n=1 Tax=Enterococcus casseliflavus TaxID=37734 RepID=UPI0009C13B91|nr:YopX family protein [Enterococcus casseliflavus]OQO86011.1 hypothetical protein BH748_06770 [Enterococcus casseliflavus]